VACGFNAAVGAAHGDDGSNRLPTDAHIYVSGGIAISFNGSGDLARADGGMDVTLIVGRASPAVLQQSTATHAAEPIHEHPAETVWSRIGPQASALRLADTLLLGSFHRPSTMLDTA
jgi:hypothetical protein